MARRLQLLEVMKQSSRRDLGAAERAVYLLVQQGGLGALHAPLYRRQLGALVAAGLVVREGDAYRDAAGDLPAVLRPSRPAPPKPRAVPMATLVVRVPAEVLTKLDAIGPSRSDATRNVLRDGLILAGVA